MCSSNRVRWGGGDGRGLFKKGGRGGFPLRLPVGGGYLLSHSRSTIGVVRLNFSVRNGKRWDPHAITALARCGARCGRRDASGPSTGTRRPPVSAGSLQAAEPGREAGLRHARHLAARAVFCLCAWAHRKALGQLVRLGSGRRRPCTCRLSTSSSPTALRRGLILRLASRLDAFSAYPCPARIPGGAPGGTTG